MHGFLQIDAEAAITAYDHIGANPDIGWHVAARVGNTVITTIVPDLVFSAFVRGRYQSAREGFLVLARTAQRGQSAGNDDADSGH